MLFHFSDFALVLCCVECVERHKARRELVKGENPPPPKSLCGVYKNRLLFAIFLKNTRSTKTLHTKNKRNNRLEFKLVHIERDSVQVLVCLLYFLGVKLCSGFVSHFGLQFIFFWVYTSVVSFRYILAFKLYLGWNLLHRENC